MPFSSTSVQRRPIAKVMAFVDGGYLRQYCTQKSVKKIDYQKLKKKITESFSNCNEKYDGDLIRIYYYDAIFDSSDTEHMKQKHLFDEIDVLDGYEVRLGQLVRTKDGSGPPKQKGVDVLLAIDMITMAYNDQFEFAVLLAGDGDFLEVVDAVKSTGKRVFGMYFQGTIADDLRRSLDARIDITKFVNDLETPA